MTNLGFVTPPVGEDKDVSERLTSAAFDEIKTAFNGRIDWANLSPALQTQLMAGQHSDVPLVSEIPSGQPDGQPIDLLVDLTTVWPLIKVDGKWVSRGAGTPLESNVGESYLDSYWSWNGAESVAVTVPAAGSYEVRVDSKVSGPYQNVVDAALGWHVNGVEPPTFSDDVLSLSLFSVYTGVPDLQSPLSGSVVRSLATGDVLSMVGVTQYGADVKAVRISLVPRVLDA